MRKKNNYDYITNKRIIIYLIFIIILFSFILFKFAEVMIIRNDDYKKMLDELSYSKVSGTSTPRGRIYDRNYNIIVDNKSLKTIIYKKKKGTTTENMLNDAKVLANHISVDYNKLKLRNKKEYFCAKNKDYCSKLIKKSEYEKIKQKN